MIALLEYIDHLKLLRLYLSGRGMCPDIEGVDMGGLIVYGKLLCIHYNIL